MVDLGDNKLPKIILYYNGLFDFDGLYSAIIDWVKNQGFMWHEIDYKHKVPSPKGAEQELKWEITKNVNNFVRYYALFTVHIWDMLEVEVESEGKKKSLTNARMYIWIEGKVVFDWQKKFQDAGRVGRKMGEWYVKIMDRDFSNYLDQFYYRLWDLHAIIKTYFDLQSKKHAFKGYLGES
jgi:hypothetical protein